MVEFAQREPEERRRSSGARPVVVGFGCVADNELLVGSEAWSQGYPVMPKGGAGPGASAGAV